MSAPPPDEVSPVSRLPEFRKSNLRLRCCLRCMEESPPLEEDVLLPKLKLRNISPSRFLPETLFGLKLRITFNTSNNI